MELIWDKISSPLKGLFLGNIQHGSVLYDDSIEQYVLITMSHDVLEFEHKKGIALCIGIDRQYHPEYAKKAWKMS